MPSEPSCAEQPRKETRRDTWHNRPREQSSATALQRRAGTQCRHYKCPRPFPGWRVIREHHCAGIVKTMRGGNFPDSQCLESIAQIAPVMQFPSVAPASRDKKSHRESQCQSAQFSAEDDTHGKRCCKKSTDRGSVVSTEETHGTTARGHWLPVFRHTLALSVTSRNGLVLTTRSRRPTCCLDLLMTSREP
jgi:hypothetical protein